MKHNEKITEDNYREVVLKRAIITCWILLAICLVVKIFGGNFFNIVCANEKFVKICEFIDSSWVYYIFAFVSYNLTNILLFKCASVNKKSKVFVKFVAILISEIYWVFKVLVDTGAIKVNMTIYSIFDALILVLIIYLYSLDFKRSLLSLVFMFAFSIISTFVKNISLVKPMIRTTLITFIYLIDYYIMLLMFYLYECKIKKGGE